MNEFLKITYEHQCTCERHGQQVVVHPDCRDGVALGVIAPQCVETGAALVEVGRDTQ